MRKIFISLAALFLLAGFSACSSDKAEYEQAVNLRNEYRAQLAELHQTNETMNRNISAAYQELEALKIMLAEKAQNQSRIK